MGVVPFGWLVVMLRWSRPGVFLAIVLSAVQQFADGDLAPWDNPDGQVNAADVLIAVQLALGRRTPGPLQFAHGDMNVDGVIDLADLLVDTISRA